jgi:hypothetical protein
MTFVEQTAASSHDSGPTPPQRGISLSRRAWILLGVFVLLLATVGGFLCWRHTHQPAQGPIGEGYSAANYKALQAVAIPQGFHEIDGAWGCQAGRETRCFVTDRSGSELARAVAQELQSTQIIWKVSTPTSRWGDGYFMCVPAGPQTVVLAGLQPYVVNAVNRAGAWTIKPGATPRFHGSVLSVSLYGTSPCTTQSS